MTISRTSSDRLIQYGQEGTVLIVSTAAPSWSDAAWAEFLEGSPSTSRRCSSWMLSMRAAHEAAGRLASTQVSKEDERDSFSTI